MRGVRSALVLLCLCLSSAARADEPAVRFTPRADGSAIEWRMYGRTDAPRQGVIVLAQGSGCAPAAQNPNVQRARAIAPDLVAIAVEKYGVSGDDAASETCAQTFYDHFTLSGRVDDYQRVLAALRREPWWSGELVLMGGSEGGAAMAMLGGREADADAVVLLSIGGGWSLARHVAAFTPPEQQAELERGFDAARAQPDSSELLLGNAYRYWADALDHVYTEDMLRTRAPILLIHGDADTSAPVGSARAARDGFAAAGRDTLTYWEEAGWDHGMVDQAGVSHLDEVFGRARVWVAAQLHDPS